VVFVKVLDGCDYLSGLLSGRSVVKVDERITVYFPF
jgi:hypothetical protein